MNCFCGTSRAAPATIVPPQLDLFDISQTKWRILTVVYKQWISERWRVGFWGEMAVEGYFEELFVFFRSVLALFFSQNAVFPCPQDVAENVFDLPEEPSHSPVFPKKRPPTPQINTQFGFFHSSPRVNQSPRPPRRRRTPPTLPRRFWRTAVWTTWIGFTNLDARVKEFTGQDLFVEEDATKAMWMQNESRIIVSIIVAKKTNKKIHGGLLKPSSRWGPIVFYYFLT